ncbi:hypothetical protein [Sphingomonas sp. 8AM]|uniref:hypothetical protein n=1 Tax=Sphingomonas sp. 8AM TaxID=2653170 RepID=UPI0012F31397|nr:hypothetical protein [Sphingomonas sp. 8AM]VXC59843.1 conserved exported hypothetical protein [Sphingomonas sp. 8AM]
MRILLTAVALTLSLPAAAQTGISGRIVPVDRDNNARIDREHSAGRLSRGDARRAKGENGVTGSLADRYASDGHLSDDEQAEITNRNNAMRSILDAPARAAPKR